MVQSSVESVQLAVDRADAAAYQRGLEEIQRFLASSPEAMKDLSLPSLVALRKLLVVLEEVAEEGGG